MQRTAAITFLVVFLMANTAFGQLLRFPVLVHHYIEHFEQDNSVSVMEFLSEHYADKINHPDDSHHDHEKLPFKSGDCQSNPSIVLIPGLSYSVFHVCSEDVCEIIYTGEANYSNSYLDSIWQPPRN